MANTPKFKRVVSMSVPPQPKDINGNPRILMELSDLRELVTEVKQYVNSMVVFTLYTDGDDCVTMEIEVTDGRE